MAQVLGAQMVIATAVFMVFLGALVFLARPGGALNRALGALFLLRGSADLMTQLMRQAPSVADAAMYHAVAHWYECAVPFLTLLLLHLLFPPERRAPWRWWALGAAGVATLLFSPVVAEAPTFPDPSDPGFRGFIPVGGPWAEAFLVLLWLTRGLTVVVTALVASSPSRSVLQRRQAGLVGLAFLFLTHVWLTRLGNATLGGDLDLWTLPSTFVALLCLAGALFAIPRLVQPFDAGSRGAMTLVALVPLAAGVADVYLLRLPGYLGSRFLMAAAHAAFLALAIVRYDILGMGSLMQRRVETFSRGMLAAAALLLPTGLVLVLLGASSTGLVVALALATGALAISPTPARALARGFARAFTPDPLDPAVAAERARIYAAALGRHPEGAPELAKLRDDLGFAEDDHLALSRMLAAHDRTAPGRQRPLLGRYLVERELGRGAFGTALLAVDVGTGRRVVLKRYHSGQGEKRASAEARALAQVRHPRVVPLLAVERVGDQVFLVLEYVEGGTAEALLATAGRLAPGRAAALLLDVLDGLDAIHAAGLAHGDVKPANILLDAGGRALVGDLGAAQALSRAEVDMTLTVAPVLGSYATMAPEVLRGARRTAAADVYSSGALLYRLLTGQDYVLLPPKDLVGATEAILHAPPRLPHPLVPAAFEPILARALAKAPEARYASAGGMREDLLRAAREEEQTPTPALERR